MVGRVLVTTAMEETWPTQGTPLLFLGEWCRLYDRKSAWENRDTVVATYHWDDRAKLHADYLYLQTLHEELLTELVARLNALHHVNHSVRYWRIIIGPWLGYFIQMLFDRWAMLRKAVRDNDVSGVCVLQRSDNQLVPRSMADFSSLFIGDVWNEMIFGQLLAWMEVPVSKLALTDKAPVGRGYEVTVRLKRKILRTLAQAASLVSSVLCRQTEYFFISSYLPIRQDFLLQFKLGQVPKLWRPVEPPPLPVNRSMRQWEMRRPANADDFPAMLRAMIPRHLPTAYLEGYAEMVSMAKNLAWPKKPKAIFTANSWYSDDVFKAWTAAKVEEGVPLVIGQHGGNYGMALWNFTEEHQIAICDRFLTWGSGRQAPGKITPVGNLKGFGRRGAWTKEGYALLVGMALPRISYHMYSVPVAGQWLGYFADQCRFVQALPEGLRAQVLVRLSINDYGWCQKDRWRERFPGIRLDDGVQPMVSLVKKCRLNISTYNATTYLESMSLNIPTIMFWNRQHWELRESAVPFFEKLKSVGIFHESPESAAQQMVAVWDDVAGWWESDAVKSVLKEFCEHYAHLPAQPLERMRMLFAEIAQDHQGPGSSHHSHP